MNGGELVGSSFPYNAIYDAVLHSYWVVAGIDLVEATRLGNGFDDVQLQIASNMRTIKL